MYPRSVAGVNFGHGVAVLQPLCYSRCAYSRWTIAYRHAELLTIAISVSESSKSQSQTHVLKFASASFNVTCCKFLADWFFLSQSLYR